MIALVAAALARPEVPPPNRLSTWDKALTVPSPGTRVGLIVVASDPRPLHIDVGTGGTWVTARETFRHENTSVLFADLPSAATTVRLQSPDRARIQSLDWDLFAPDPEPRADGAAPPTPGVLPAELTSIGVVSRAAWGARATTCSTTEDDWYRMAIHHSAGSQTYGGTVEGEVQVLQAYAQDSGEYCDIPYQFLVGYDGSLWEGRPYGYYSGATGGNNDGDIAVCFLGCYHPTDCSESHAVTEEMIDSGHLLVQTLVAMNDIPSDADSIRGHRDWPTNSTACPGDWLYERLDDLRAPLTPAYAGTWIGQSFPTDTPLTIRLGGEQAGYVDLTNSGTETWTPGATFLGTIPRDTPSALADETWISSTRAATVDAVTAPGQTGRFSFTIQGNTLGTTDQYFGVVQEWVTWFADDGGPSDTTIHVPVLVYEPVDSGPTEDSPVPDTGARPGTGAPEAIRPGETVAFTDLGCGCEAGPGGGAYAALFATMAIRRRRRADRNS